MNDKLVSQIEKVIRNPSSKTVISQGPNGENEGEFKIYEWDKPLPYERYPENLAVALASRLRLNKEKTKEILGNFKVFGYGKEEITMKMYFNEQLIEALSQTLTKDIIEVSHET